jgi:hypothetical protein
MQQPFKIILYSGLLVAFIISCSSSKESSKETSKSTALLYSKKKKGFENPENYLAIDGNIGRLHAMLTGQFVQKIRRAIDQHDNDIYETWLVNDDKDSVMLYSFPLGNEAKIGHWIYHYQIMTTLPNEPVYESFEHLEIIDRDSIKSTYYKPPSDFNIPLKDLVKNYQRSFDEIELNKLTIDEDGGTYVRQERLFFNNIAGIVADEVEKGAYKRDVYGVYPTEVFYKTIFFKDKEGKTPTGEVRTKFIKLEIYEP